MLTREQLRRLAQSNYAEYMMGDPFSEDAIDGHERSLSSLTEEEREIYSEVSRELAAERAADRAAKGS